MGWLRISELAKKYGVSYRTLYRFVHKYGMPSKKALMLVEYVGSGGKFDKEVKKRKQKREVLMVREEDWLDVPTFLRKKIRKK